MKRELLITGIFSMLFLTDVNATDGDGRKKTKTPAKKSSSIIQKTVYPDSIAPNKAFSELFDNSSTNNVRLNPRAAGFVQDYMDKNTTHLLKIKDWGRPYFNLMEGILEQHGLPVELKYLAVIESKLKSNAVSWAGAVGPWQFMPGTARSFGLKVTRGRDDRKDYFKSTHAAAKYLKGLYNIFGDWLLVIAAYNGGPGNVYSAIRKSGSRNFWDLQYYLPAESRTHVKKFIGTHYIFEGQGGVTTLTKAETTAQIGASSGYLVTRNLTAEEFKNATTVTISGKYHSSIIAKNIMMDLVEFNRYNPEFDKLIANSENIYELKLPTHKMELFVANKYQILNESVQLLLSPVTVSVIPSTNKNIDKK